MCLSPDGILVSAEGAKREINGKTLFNWPKLDTTPDELGQMWGDGARLCMCWRHCSKLPVLHRLFSPGCLAPDGLHK